MIIQDAAGPPVDLREAYLRSLAEPQELYLESLVHAGRTLLIRPGDDGEPGDPVGYAVVSDGAVVEFFVVPGAWAALPAAFAAILTRGGVGRALCKTFDPLMLTAAASAPARTRTVGYLFRAVRDRAFDPDPEITARPALPGDMESVWAIHDGFFDDRAELERYVADDALMLYEGVKRELLGCGTLTRVIPGTDAVDVGMVVAPARRRRGLGTYIVAHLKNLCLQAGDRPIAGCDAENAPSRRALENAGFATAHSIVEFTFWREPGRGV